MKTYENIPIFQYGMSANGFCIPEDVAKKCIDSFKNAPIFIYGEDDPYNKNNVPIGIITETGDVKDSFVFGNVSIYKDEEINKFINYGIQFEESHKENDITIVDKFTLTEVSFDLK